MIHQLKKLRLSAIFIAFLTGLAPVEASSACPCRTSGTAVGLGLGVKLLNLKNISTRTTPLQQIERSHDAFANASTPVISLYARQYMPNLLWTPAFIGLEFDYLTDLHKRDIYYRFNNLPGNPLDTGYNYKENWDARLMLGAQLGCWSQLDLWAQAGVQLTYFEYEGITSAVNALNTHFRMDNHVAVAPAGGLEIRFSKPNLVSNKVVTDFILGWTAGYRNAFAVLGNAPSGNSYKIAMNANWTHTFGLKVLFRF